MTDLTDDQVRALLTDEESVRVVAKEGKGCGPAMAVRLADALLQARADATAAHEKGMDDAADKILDWLAKAVGATEYTACDGSETWDGDVHGTIYAILKAGGVYDDEDGRVAKLADAAAAVAFVVERAARGVSDLTHWIGDDGHGTTLVALQDALTAIRALAPDAGTAELAKLKADRLQGQKDYCALMERHDTLAVENAQANLRAKNAYMRGLLDSAQHLRSTIPDKPEGWEQVESMARMLDAMATRAAAKAVAG